MQPSTDPSDFVIQTSTSSDEASAESSDTHLVDAIAPVDKERGTTLREGKAVAEVGPPQDAQDRQQGAAVAQCDVRLPWRTILTIAIAVMLAALIRRRRRVL